jgi:hypothetical protein
MNATMTKHISRTQLHKGDIVHFYGARFEIEEDARPTFCYDTNLIVYGLHGAPQTACCVGRWVDGEIIPGYFGPELPFGFQGNHLAMTTVERA